MSTKSVRHSFSENIEFSPKDVVKITASYGIKQEYAVDRKIVSVSSSVLRERLSSNSTKEISFDWIIAIDLKIYLNWLYSGVLRIVEEGESDEDYNLVDGYILGLGLDDQKYCDAIIDAFYAKAQELRDKNPQYLPDTSCLGRAFQNEINVKKGQGSTEILQRALVDIYAQADDPQRVYEVLEDGEDIPSEFKNLLIRRLMEDRKKLSTAQLQQRGGGEVGSGGEEQARKRVREE
ncbi:hypothetical protein PRZ48_011958 [Zasmidium cellare]|uniref:BTB domain-containing protein n=1 Tax=Zasmidium cellare TaxID=395010 RepID=A0ABR0E7V3_ZASCE|nr:hypothetical protein PRZ48_011958 [Zasmidium cellare]